MHSKKLKSERNQINNKCIINVHIFTLLPNKSFYQFYFLTSKVRSKKDRQVTYGYKRHKDLCPFKNYTVKSYDQKKGEDRVRVVRNTMFKKVCLLFITVNEK